MIKFIKNDFISVRANLSYMVGKNIPMGIAILYYILVGLLALPLMPFVMIWSRMQLKKYKEYNESEA